jgi:glycosyltransferase involved in cell wall biosynthesis
MRVLIDYRPAFGERSGVGEYLYQLVRALAARQADSSRPPTADLHITLFTSSWKSRPHPSLVAGLPIVDRRIPVSVLNLAWHRLQQPPVEWLAGGRFDVVHSPHPLLIPSRGAAQVVTIHDLDFLRHPERTAGEIRRDYPALAARHAARADMILTPSAHTAREVESLLRVPRDKLVVCPHGGPAWSARAAAPDRGYILFVGTLEPRKNVGTLLAAYERLLAVLPGAPDLTLAGGASIHAGPWLEAIRQPPFAGRVRHLGYVAPEDRVALYSGARLLVLPSYEEGFGLPALEAMTTGVPVVASSAGALPEVIGTAGLLVEPDDVEGLAAAMSRVITEEAVAGVMTARGIARAQSFSWAAAADRTVAAYAEAVERRRRGRAGSPPEQEAAGRPERPALASRR